MRLLTLHNGVIINDQTTPTNLVQTEQLFTLCRLHAMSLTDPLATPVTFHRRYTRLYLYNFKTHETAFWDQLWAEFRILKQ